jgi:hypothetical protein
VQGAVNLNSKRKVSRFYTLGFSGGLFDGSVGIQSHGIYIYRRTSNDHNSLGWMSRRRLASRSDRLIHISGNGSSCGYLCAHYSEGLPSAARKVIDGSPRFTMACFSLLVGTGSTTGKAEVTIASDKRKIKTRPNIILYSGLR